MQTQRCQAQMTLTGILLTFELKNQFRKCLNWQFQMLEHVPNEKKKTLH